MIDKQEMMSLQVLPELFSKSNLPDEFKVLELKMNQYYQIGLKYQADKLKMSLWRKTAQHYGRDFVIKWRRSSMVFTLNPNESLPSHPPFGEDREMFFLVELARWGEVLIIISI